jgi:hypothetical protein
MGQPDQRLLRMPLVRALQTPIEIGRPSALAWIRNSPVLAPMIVTRLIIWVVGLAVIARFGENVAAAQTMDPATLTAPFHSLLLDKLLAPGARWDSVWYLSVANKGYFSPASTNFFPLYPLLIAVGTSVTSQPLLAGMAISLVSMLAALTLLYRLVRLDLAEPAARLTVLLVLIYPMSFFLSAVYTESVFLLLTVGAFYAARRERWAIAGLCGALASATRSDGAMLIIPIVLMYLYGPRAIAPTRAVRRWWSPRFRVTRSAGWLALMPSGLAAYMAYLAIAHGAPLAPFHSAEADWGRTFAGPFGAVIRLIGTLPGDIQGLLVGSSRAVGPGDPLTWNLHDLIDLVFLIVGFGSLAASWRRVPMPYFAYALTVLLYSSSFPYPHAPLQALPRYLLPIFPLFMGVASRLVERPRLRIGVIACSSALLAVFSGLWAIWALIP